MRLNQFISSSGYCSRRQADRLIWRGEVTVNERTATIGNVITMDDVVKIAGKQIFYKENDIYLMLNKPRGITCTAANHIEGNIIEFMNYPERIFPVGRLDKQSTGLILLTNDGGIVNELLQGQESEEKEYIVTVDKPISSEFILQMGQGVKIYNPRKKAYVVTEKCRLVQLDTYRFQITLRQGLNRQIRRMCRYFQYTVTELQRIRLKHLTIDGLAEGKWRYLTKDEISKLVKKQSS